MIQNQHELSQYIKAEALRLGFSDCGISRVEVLVEESEKLEKWVEKSYHAELDYMARNQNLRKNVEELVPNAKSVISLILNYYPGDITYDEDKPKIAKYSLGRDYHKYVKKMLKALFFSIKEKSPEMEGRFFVDSAPVMDRVWAKKSGLGWTGKNTNLIHPKLGSFIFIAEIICNLELEDDQQKVTEYCGKCTRCIDACPTQAITEPYHIDAYKCISYQTIEKKGDISPEYVSKLNNYIFGCDICQDVCPWNKRAKTSKHPDIGSRKEWLNLSFQDYLDMNQKSFDKLFSGAAIKRAGLDKIQRTIQSILVDKKQRNTI